jgi:hypothetical protein
MEVIEDLKQGYYNGEQESGDKPEPGVVDNQEAACELPIESSESLNH